MGQLRKRGNIWWLRYYRAGRRYEETSGSTRKSDAERLLRIREGDIARGIPVTSKVGQLRFDEAAADVVADYRVNGKRSLRDVETRIRLHLEPVFGGRRMAAITTTDVRAYTTERQGRGAAAASINRELAILKRAFRLAAQAGKLLHLPHIPMLREDNVRTGFFERDEFEAVRDALPEPLRAVVTFGYLTGWRVNSEVLPLRWSQVDRRAKTIRLQPGMTKNREGRVLPTSCSRTWRRSSTGNGPSMSASRRQACSVPTCFIGTEGASGASRTRGGRLASMRDYPANSCTIFGGPR